MWDRNGVRVDYSNTAFEAIIKVTFASSTSEDLSLHDEIIILCIFVSIFISIQMCDAILSFFATCSASSGVLATNPGGTPTPYYSKYHQINAFS
jgi:uncharacterized membrane protein AbrB (regulator of aidB expression)